MKPYETKVPKSNFVFNHDAWYSGIDGSMKTLGSAQSVTPYDLIREQNAAIRECWVATGNHVRQAMFVLSDHTNIYPEELKDDTECQKMLANVKVRA